MRNKLNINLFSNLSMRTKLFLLFCLISIVPILILGFLAINISLKSMTEKEVGDSYDRLNQINIGINKFIQEKNNAAIALSLNFDIQDFLDNEVDKTKGQFSEFETKRQLIKYYNSKGTASISLIRSDGLLMHYSTSEAINVRKIQVSTDDFLRRDIYENYYLIGNTTLENGIPVIPYTRKIISTKTGKISGILTMNIKEVLIEEVCSEINDTNDIKTELIIVNNNTIQSHKNKMLIGKNFFEIYTLDPKLLSQTQGFAKFKVQHNEFLLVYRYNPEQKLLAIEKIDVRDLFKKNVSMIFITIFISIICLLICLLASFLVSRSITKPLTELIKRIANTQASKPSYPYNKSKYSIFGESYNSIVKRLNSLLNDFYHEQNKKKEAELRALEFQINPHFLYNTLSTIVWLIEKNEKKSAIHVTKQLSSFFRISVSNGRNLISIHQEIEHIKLYIEIQKVRYSDSFDIFFDIDESISKILTPKLILQPLVENSLYHGIRKLKDGKGQIIIRGWKHEGDVFLEVHDNGKELTCEQANEINYYLRNYSERPNLKNYGIGIVNVNDRIAMCYGDGYGLTFQRDEEWTVAQIKINAEEIVRNG